MNVLMSRTTSTTIPDIGIIGTGEGAISISFLEMMVRVSFTASQTTEIWSTLRTWRLARGGREMGAIGALLFGWV